MGCENVLCTIQKPLVDLKSIFFNDTLFYYPVPLYTYLLQDLSGNKAT